VSKLSKLIQQFLSNPPEVRFEELVYVLEALGFEEKRSKGSHHTFADSQGRVFTIPKKGGKKVKRIYIKKIVTSLELIQWRENIPSELSPDFRDEETQNEREENIASNPQENYNGEPENGAKT